MRHKELTDHILGSFLKQQYLEAFLVQSAYIESLLKIYFDVKYYSATEPKEQNVEQTVDPKIQENKIFLKTIGEYLNRLNFYELNKILREAKLITEDQFKLLDKYRVKRNGVLHELLMEINKTTFEKDLKEVCEIGNRVIESQEFQTIVKVLERIEEILERKRKAEDSQRKLQI